MLGSAILDTWVKRESSSSEFLVRFLRDKRVDLPDNMDTLNDAVESDAERTEREIQDALMKEPLPLDNPFVENEATNVGSQVVLTNENDTAGTNGSPSGKAQSSVLLALHMPELLGNHSDT